MSWQKQAPDKPLFPDLLWSKPQNKRSAGKLAIIGGQANEFAQVAKSYGCAQASGAGHIRVLMPDSLKKVAGGLIEGLEFAPSNKSGSFARTALASFFELYDWADRVLLAGDFGKNSETTIILDGLTLKSSAKLVVSYEALGSIGISLSWLAGRDITLILSFAKLQKLAGELDLSKPIISSMPLAKLAGALSEISLKNNAKLIIFAEELVWVAADGQISSTKATRINSGEIAAFAAVWLAQNPAKQFEALTTAVFEAIN